MTLAEFVDHVSHIALRPVEKEIIGIGEAALRQGPILRYVEQVGLSPGQS